MSHLLHRFSAAVRRRLTRRNGVALVLACVLSLTLALGEAWRRSVSATARLDSAARALRALTNLAPGDDQGRAAIAWGYAERLRLGLDSPFRLIEAAARDPRLTSEERRTVSWALLGRVLHGEALHIEPAALDLIGPSVRGVAASGEQHLALIQSSIAAADDPRAAELAVRLAYTLASTERLVDGTAPVLAAEAAALTADREIARREARALMRSVGGGADPVQRVRERRERRSLYVERPALLAPSEELERAAIAMTDALLDSLRAMRPAGESRQPPDTANFDNDARVLAARLSEAGSRLPPLAPLAVTVQRYLPMVRPHRGALDVGALSRAKNPEMLAAAAQASSPSRSARRALGRLLLAAAVSVRSTAQERVWFGGDTMPSAAAVARRIGVASISFDSAVPAPWRPYYLSALVAAMNDLRRVLPALRLDAVHFRFRTDAPVDSALAMHDPRTRTLHLPIGSAGGTLTHELAHDLDRQSAMQLGLAGYRSDIVARRGASSPGNRIAASLRALTEEMAEAAPARSVTERPAEVFATRVDWFVANALAREGISSGFLSAVEDELLTGHVVHPERLRGASRSRSLLTALEAMTPVADFATTPEPPSAQTLLRWALAGPVDRGTASRIVAGLQPWSPPYLTAKTCEDAGARVALIRMAAESRARGWLRLRARWMDDSSRAPWARAMLGQVPWADHDGERRIDALRDHVLVALAAPGPLASGLSAYGAALAVRARCE